MFHSSSLEDYKHVFFSLRTLHNVFCVLPSQSRTFFWHRHPGFSFNRLRMKNSQTLCLYLYDMYFFYISRTYSEEPKHCGRLFLTYSVPRVAKVTGREGTREKSEGSSLSRCHEIDSRTGPRNERGVIRSATFVGRLLQRYHFRWLEIPYRRPLTCLSLAARCDNTVMINIQSAS